MMTHAFGKLGLIALVTAGLSLSGCATTKSVRLAQSAADAAQASAQKAQATADSATSAAQAASDSAAKAQLGADAANTAVQAATTTEQTDNHATNERVDVLSHKVRELSARHHKRKHRVHHHKKVAKEPAASTPTSH